MPVDLENLVQDLVEDNTFQDIATSPRLQRGRRDRPLILSDVLPEDTVDELMFRDTAMESKATIADDAARDSPIGFSGKYQIADFIWELVDTQKGEQLTTKHYETLIRNLGSSASPQQLATRIVPFMQNVGQGLADKREQQRAQVLTNGQLRRESSSGAIEPIDYPIPASQFVSVSAGDSQNIRNASASDPFGQIIDFADSKLDSEGLQLNRIITSRQVLRDATYNSEIQKYGQSALADQNGDLTFVQQSRGMPLISRSFDAQGLPIPEEYNAYYDTQNGQERFIPNNMMLLLFQTGQRRTIEIPDATDPIFLYDTLGYTAIGPAAGNPTGGVQTKMKADTESKPSIRFYGWQNSAPIVQIPEAVVRITFEV